MRHNREVIGSGVILAFIILSFSGAFRFFNPHQLYIDLFEPEQNIHKADLQYLRLLKCIQSELEPAEEVGFFTALDPDEHDYFYRLTQFGLVPVIVIDTLDKHLVVGYFPNSDAWMNAPIELKLVTRCPGRLLILENPQW